MHMRSRLLTTPGVLGLVTALTLVALMENTVAPWAPFYVLYAALCTILPLWLGTYRFGRLRDLRAWIWVLVLLSPFLLQLLVGLWTSRIYPALVLPFGVGPAAAQGAGHSLGAALPELFDRASDLWRTDAATIGWIYLLFILAWAGLGEELFYRGYVQGVLRRRHGFAFAALTSAIFFGVRHATQLALLWPAYPWGAAASWVVISFVFGLFMSFLYERSNSLHPPVIVHYLFNLIPALVVPLLSG